MTALSENLTGFGRSAFTTTKMKGDRILRTQEKAVIFGKCHAKLAEKNSIQRRKDFSAPDSEPIPGPDIEKFIIHTDALYVLAKLCGIISPLLPLKQQ